MELLVLCVACLTGFVNCLVKQLAIFFGVVVILLLWKCSVWVELLCWIDRVWSCVCCACGPSVYLDVPSIGLVYVCVCRKSSPHLGV